MICLEIACLEVICLEIAYLEVIYLEIACLEVICLEMACLEIIHLEIQKRIENLVANFNLLIYVRYKIDGIASVFNYFLERLW